MIRERRAVSAIVLAALLALPVQSGAAESKAVFAAGGYGGDCGTTLTCNLTSPTDWGGSVAYPSPPLFQGYGFSSTMIVNGATGNPAAPTVFHITGLPPHDKLTLEFLLALADSWDGIAPGEYGPDYLNITVDGVSIFQGAFCNQGYDVAPRETCYWQVEPTDNRIAWGHLGFVEQGRDANADTVYDYTGAYAFKDIPHTASSVTVRWFASGAGWQGWHDPLWGVDEGFGLDHITVTVKLTNTAPSAAFSSPVDGQLFQVNTTVNAQVSLVDPDAGDSHNCTLDWGDDTADTGVCNVGVGLTLSHAYTATGVYTIAATVTDAAGEVGGSEVMVVVYDPNAGFVTGGGWIASPAGAYKPDASLVGQAKFGFVSKYKKGATVPDGDTQFVFETGGMSFVSTSYDWLVVTGTGSSKAQFKGSGVINGVGSYGFLLYATDADRTSDLTDKDRFRIKIWDKAAGDADVYDNGVEQPIGAGNIVIHTGNPKK